MANGRALVAAIIFLLFLCFVRARCDVASASPSSPEQGQELQMLRSKVASLEDEINARKEETLHLENVVREKSAQIAALVSELEVLQVPNVIDDESVLKANAHNEMLEKQIVRLGRDLEDQVKKGESLEAHASEAKKSLIELTGKLDSAEKVNLEQKQKIEELNHSLQQAKDRLVEMEREAKLKGEELTKVHGMWLPHWVMELSDKWQLRGKSVLDVLLLKVSENLAHVHRLVQPHMKTAQNKLVPTAKAHLNSLKNSADAYASAIATRSTKLYKVCRDTIHPSMAKVQDFADHYWQESKKLSTPYITQIVAASEPHITRAGAVLEPYTRPAVSAWRRVFMSASLSHRQVQKGIKHFVNDNGLLKPDSADKLAWFTASALVALPMFYTYKMLSAAMRRAVAAQGGGSSGSTKASSNRRRTRRADS
ncbi:kinesin-like protein KIF7 isoform X2 [Oryza brachyantha]|uniref:kinesin-like protein KIF7 isoform X2 n=1 Tax=Oryza brachyantha TaxID=4533 RepID=UPI0007769949|nr:kinesin-like protein KIF7 isoform X2 [Oryza brachyantha]